MKYRAYSQASTSAVAAIFKVGAYLSVVYSVFPTGVGIQVASHVFELYLQLVLASLGRALEGHVLQEVSRAIVFGRLIPAASVDKNADGGSLSMAALQDEASHA